MRTGKEQREGNPMRGGYEAVSSRAGGAEMRGAACCRPEARKVSSRAGGRRWVCDCSFHAQVEGRRYRIQHLPRIKSCPAYRRKNSVMVFTSAVNLCMPARPRPAAHIYASHVQGENGKVKKRWAQCRNNRRRRNNKPVRRCGIRRRYPKRRRLRCW